MGKGGLAEALAKLKQNYEVLKGQLGLNNPEIEVGKASLRTGHFRILPSAEPQEAVVEEMITVDGADATVTTVQLPPASCPLPEPDTGWRASVAPAETKAL